MLGYFSLRNEISTCPWRRFCVLRIAWSLYVLPYQTCTLPGVRPPPPPMVGAGGAGSVALSEGSCPLTMAAA
jgi:hypothetical protein